MFTVEELERQYEDLIEDAQNVRTTAGSVALAISRKHIQEQLKAQGHHGFDFNQ